VPKSLIDRETDPSSFVPGAPSVILRTKKIPIQPIANRPPQQYHPIYFDITTLTFIQMKKTDVKIHEIQATFDLTSGEPDM
jgi:hypothetical protein